MPSQNLAYYNDFPPELCEKYESAVDKLRHALAKGHTYDQACGTLTDLDQDMQAFVREDFLKTLIAEEHFGAGIEIADMALFLGLSYEKLESSMLTLLHDMANEATMHYKDSSALTQ